MDVYKLRNIVVSLQGGKHCFAKTRGCLPVDRRTLVRKRVDACWKAEVVLRDLK